MAAKTATFDDLDSSVKHERTLMNKLRDKGLEYVSSSGKLIAAKTQPEHFCHCPQKCKNKLPHKNWNALFKQFYDMGDQNKQNQFLQSHIVIKAVHLHNWESERPSPANKRRVTCRYHVPLLTGNSKLDEFIKQMGNNSVEVCQKAFMNCFGITEKRVRMQRERCISRLAPGHYKNSPFGKRHTVATNNIDSNLSARKYAEGFFDVDITPLDLNDDKKLMNGKKKEVYSSTEDSWSEGQEGDDDEGGDYDEDDMEQPLHASSSRPIFYSAKPLSMDMDISKTKLYELAEKFGVPKDRIDKEMTQKYEQLVRENLRKQQKILAKYWQRYSFEDLIENYNQREIENRRPSVKTISQEVEGLKEDFAILPIQTLNNGDLTITPVLGPVTKPVGNRDIMRVNSFFQNQLWKPEYLGLSSWHKLKTHSFDS